MSELLAEHASRVRLSDPTPTRCAACFSGPTEDSRFVDFNAAIDRGAVVQEGSMAVIDSIDELHLCEACVRSAAEVIAFKPQLHARQLREIKRQGIEIEHWKATVRRVNAELDAQLASGLGEPQTRRRS